jgi:hypothetical protein
MGGKPQAYDGIGYLGRWFILWPTICPGQPAIMDCLRASNRHLWPLEPVTALARGRV